MTLLQHFFLMKKNFVFLIHATVRTILFRQMIQIVYHMLKKKNMIFVLMSGGQSAQEERQSLRFMMVHLMIKNIKKFYTNIFFQLQKNYLKKTSGNFSKMEQLHTLRLLLSNGLKIYTYHLYHHKRGLQILRI